jgi:hypothetical protein
MGREIESRKEKHCARGMVKDETIVLKLESLPVNLILSARAKLFLIDNT